MKLLLPLFAFMLAYGVYTSKTPQSNGNNPRPAQYSMQARASFGDQVRVARIKKGLTSQELAKKAGISLSVLEQVERGQLALNTEVTEHLSSILQVQLDSTLR